MIWFYRRSHDITVYMRICCFRLLKKKFQVFSDNANQLSKIILIFHRAFISIIYFQSNCSFTLQRERIKRIIDAVGELGRRREGEREGGMGGTTQTGGTVDHLSHARPHSLLPSHSPHTHTHTHTHTNRLASTHASYN